MSTADRDPDEIDAPGAGSAESAADALVHIEAAPLDERATGYDALAERLRAELERSDPARVSG
ncbi:MULTISPECIES: hypothetical protein [unclassified Agromyces]|uniref:hypothetical protein n=1 Tax=unclassified Agromyces TaxID=2639701 RepID=UPI003014201D